MAHSPSRRRFIKKTTLLALVTSNYSLISLSSFDFKDSSDTPSADADFGTRGGGYYPNDYYITSVRQGNGKVPMFYALYQNYPNPFNPSTTIPFDITERTHVKLFVYDMTGRKVATLLDEVRNPGRYHVQFNGSRLASGVYFYELQAGSFRTTKKFTLIK